LISEGSSDFVEEPGNLTMTLHKVMPVMTMAAIPIKQTFLPQKIYENPQLIADTTTK
jgi:hypothetical protein